MPNEDQQRTAAVETVTSNDTPIKEETATIAESSRTTTKWAARCSGNAV
jgi:hypothetical protein